jgi:hypothetical protein
VTDARPLYDLLPAVHRSRDAELGFPLRSLLGVLEQDLERLRDDVDARYDDWFVETCAEDVLPAIADLLRLGGLRPAGDYPVSRRAQVAGTVAHRRRKGTPETLAEVAREVTGWPTRAVEYFRLLSATQHLDHPRPDNVRTPDLRDRAALARLGTPFDTTSRLVEVRHPDTGRGRYNVGAVGLHVWSLEAYPCTGLDARPLDSDAGRWSIDPAGHDRPLFARPAALTTPAGPDQAPARIGRSALHDALATVRAGGRAALLDALAVDLGPGTPVAAADLTSADLSDWTPPRPAPDGRPRVAIDPVLGRLTVPPGVRPPRIRVDCAYGFSGDVGAGPYDRRATLDVARSSAGTRWPAAVDWCMAVARDAPTADGVTGSVLDAVAAWNSRPDPGPGQVGVIRDSATYTGAVRIVLTPGSRLLVVAAVGPPAALVAVGVRPHLVGDVEVVAPGGRAVQPAELILDGLSIEGGVTVRPGDLDSLVMSSCTITTDRSRTAANGGVLRAEANPRLTVRVLRTVCAAIRLSDVPALGLADSAVHAGARTPDEDALALDAGPADVAVNACTVLGGTTARSLTASDSILRGPVTVTWRQEGYLRFSYAPPGSRLPRQYRCQPADAAAAARVGPAFTSTDPDHPGFCRLAPTCPPEIGRGAENGSEMGVFQFLQRPRRLTELAGQLRDYLRFGLEAGIFDAD